MFDLWCCLHLAHILIWMRTSTSFLWQSVAVIPLSAPLVHPLHIPTFTWGWIILLTRLPALRLVMFLAFSSPPHYSFSHSPLPSIFIHPSILSSTSPISPSLAAILDDQSVCGRGERLALALARENINSVMEGPARARVEVDIYELQKDSQYDTTDTSEWCENDHCGRITFQQTLLSTGT